MRHKIIFIISIFMLAYPVRAEEIVKEVKFGKAKAEVSYTLSKPSLVRVSLGLEDGPIFATLTDWAVRDKGAHKEKWAGTGLSEFDKLLCNDKTIFTFNYFTTDPDDKPTLDIKDIADEEYVIGPVGRASGGTNLNYLHKEHKRQFCREPKLNVTLPAGVQKTKEGLPIIDEATVLSIDIAPEDKIWFNRERYSIYIFIDTVFVHGAYEGYSPYHWHIDPKGLNKGKHLIIVNLRGFNDHLGAALLPVYIKE